LPSLVDALITCVNKDGKTSESGTKIHVEEEKNKGNESSLKSNTSAMIISDRIKLSSSARRVMHSYLDENNIHGARSTSLLDAFQVISKYPNQYLLVNHLINNSGPASNKSSGGDADVLVPPTSLLPNDAKILYTQIKMIYVHLRRIPLHTIQLPKKILIETKKTK
jgi:hypothetical protein